MQKPKQGPHGFIPAASDKCPEPFCQPCIVVATFQDGTVNLVTWDCEGKQSVVLGAVLVQECEDENGCCCPCHYEPAPVCPCCHNNPCTCPKDTEECDVAGEVASPKSVPVRNKRR